MRLGFSIRVWGQPGLVSFDAQSEQNRIGRGLVYLRDILFYLHQADLHMYRMHSRLAPMPASLDGGATDKAVFREHGYELVACGELARTWDVRLSFHPYNTVVFSTPDEDRALLSQRIVERQAAMLDGMGLDPEAVIVLHVGGVYADERRAQEAFVRRYGELADGVRRRVVLENDDRRFDVSAVLEIHKRCGVPIVFDALHHRVLNRRRVPESKALELCLQTWPRDVTPKAHYATARPDLRSASGPHHPKMPTWTEHADFVNPFDFAEFVSRANGIRPVDVMLEAKAGDMAVLKLKEDLARYAPGVAEMCQ